MGVWVGGWWEGEPITRGRGGEGKERWSRRRRVQQHHKQPSPAPPRGPWASIRGPVLTWNGRCIPCGMAGLQWCLPARRGIWSGKDRESDGEWWLLVERGRVQPFPGPALITRAGRISGDPPSTISRQVVTSGSRRGGNRSTLARRGGGREGALQTSISQECANETAALLIRSKSCN